MKNTAQHTANREIRVFISKVDPIVQTNNALV